ncbi:hypothetical protein [Streptomyces sp. BE133]|uniref:hypothetical protein n=1 Tax=Streptomyces sp. BE133 TaxID=3002523 RepID=UPI002E76FEAE|nr:hypothetical protein [Streptomyces sp. BE133]MEE1806606.1 hypothetical protein [Streptomyces sp. BE133]
MLKKDRWPDGFQAGARVIVSCVEAGHQLVVIKRRVGGLVVMRPGDHLQAAVGFEDVLPGLVDVVVAGVWGIVQQVTNSV